MIEKDTLRELIKKYFPEGSDDQIKTLQEELISELEVMTHARIRESVNFERIKRMTV